MTLYIWTYIDSGNIITTITDAPNGKGNPFFMSCHVNITVKYQTSRGEQTRYITIPPGHVSDEQTGTRALYITQISGTPSVCGGNDLVYDYPHKENKTIYVHIGYNGSYMAVNLRDNPTYGEGNHITSFCDITVEYDFILRDGSTSHNSTVIYAGQYINFRIFEAIGVENISVSPTYCSPNDIEFTYYEDIPEPPPPNNKWGLKYHMSFKDHFDTDWKVEILYDNYQGVSHELIPSENPLVIKRSSDDNTDISSVIQKSSIDISAVVELNDVRSYKTDFLIEDFTGKVLIYRQGVVFWSGWLVTDYFNYILKEGFSVFHIRATDGLSVIMNKNYSERVYEMINGYDSMYSLKDTFLSFLLDALKYESGTFNYFSSLLHDIGNNYDIFHKLWVNLEAHFDNDNFDFEGFLRCVLKSFGLRLFTYGEANANLYLIRIADMTSDSWAIDKYSYNVNAIGWTQSIDSISNPIIYMPQIINEYANISLLDEVERVEYNPKLETNNLFENSNFREFNNNELANWTYDNNGGDIVRKGGGTIKEPYYIYINNNSNLNPFKIYQEIEIPIHSSPPLLPETDIYEFLLEFDVRARHDDGLRWVFMCTNPVFSTNPNDYLHWDNEKQIWTYDEPQNKLTIEDSNIFNNKRFTIPAPPLIQYFTDWYGANRFRFVIYSYGQLFGGTDLELRNPILTNKYKDADSYRIISSNNENHHRSVNDNNIYIGDRAKRFFSQNIKNEGNSWFANNLNISTSNIQDALVKSESALNSYPREKMNVNILSNDIKPYNILKRQIDDKMFVQMDDEYNVRKAIHNMVLLEIRDKKFNSDEFEIKDNYISNKEN